MSYLQLQKEILDTELCARCGACAAVCPENIIQIQDSGLPQCVISFEQVPQVCQTCNLCTEICPGLDTGVTQAEENLFGRRRTAEERWTGIFIDTYHVTVRDSYIRNRSSAGGAATGLLLSGLKSGLVDAVLVVGRDPERPWVPRAVLTDQENEVIACAQSTYCITPNLHLLRDNPYERIGVVGLACEIQAIRKMQAHPVAATLANKIIFTLEIACASNTKLSGTEHLIQNRLRINLEDVEQVRYRDGSYPGEFAVYTKDKKRYSLPFFELVEEFKKHKTHRCLSCPDWWSGLADISIADGDPNIYASSRDNVHPERRSMVMVRTKMGEFLLRTGEELGLLQVEPAVFVPEESLGLQRKRYRAAYYAEKYPDRVPRAAIDFKDVETYRDDNEIIATMSRKNKNISR